MNTAERDTVDATREPRTMRPHVQFNRAPAPIGRAGSSDMSRLSEKIASRIRENRYKFGAGSFLLATEDGQVFVLGEQAVTTARLVAARAGDLVGLYAGTYTNGEQARCPDGSQIQDDLQQHLRDIGVLLG